MFERYTEKARRVIFCARREASNYGSPLIEPEHLLLSIFREDKRVLNLFPTGVEALVRKRLSNQPRGPKTSPSQDLPLSDESKRVLAYAAEESQQLDQRHIGCEHLFLGFLRGFAAGKLLEPFGFKVDNLRKKFEQMTPYEVAEAGRVLPPSYRGRSQPLSKLVRVHGEIWDVGYLREAIRRVREGKFYWRKASWKPCDAVVERKTGKVSLDLTLAEDSVNFELVKDGWKKDLCAICRWELFRLEDDHGTGYTNGRDWLCMECYDKLWARPDFIAGGFGEIT